MCRVGLHAAAAAVAPLLLAPGPAAADTAVIDPGKAWGAWDGWGVSLCWWANVLGDRADVADAVFTMQGSVHVDGAGTLPGLGLTIARYNAGGSSWNTAPDGSTMSVSGSIPHFKQIAGYWLDWSSDDPSSPSWDWNVDQKQRAMLQAAKARGAPHLELFSNSPMWWMTYTHNPCGARLATNDNLTPWNYGNHSKYMSSIARYARDHWGINFTSVELFNEPTSAYWSQDGHQEGCHFAASTQAELVPFLRADLDSRGLSSIAVSASDENAYDEAVSTWNSFSSEVKSAVGQVNVHGYQPEILHPRRDKLYDAVHADGKRLWDSEYGDGDGGGMSMAKVINLDFTWLHPTGWCYWQIADESGGWGMLKFDPNNAVVQQVNIKWYVFAQYTRHIRPGMLIVGGGGDDAADGGNTVAAYDAAARRLVLVTASYGSSRSVTYDLTKFRTADGPVTRWATNTGGGDMYAEHHDVTLAAKSFTSSFPEYTVQTFEIENVDIA